MIVTSPILQNKVTACDLVVVDLFFFFLKVERSHTVQLGTIQLAYEANNITLHVVLTKAVEMNTIIGLSIVLFSFFSI